MPSHPNKPPSISPSAACRHLLLALQYLYMFSFDACVADTSSLWERCPTRMLNLSVNLIMVNLAEVDPVIDMF